MRVQRTRNNIQIYPQINLIEITASSTDYEWDKNGDIVARDLSPTGAIWGTGLKSGTDQAAAGASAGEFWVDSNDGNTIKLGT